VTLHWADLALLVAIVVVGCGVTYFVMLRKLQWMLSESHRDIERRLAALTEAITIRESISSDAVAATDALTATEIEGEGAGALPEVAATHIDAAGGSPRALDREDEAEIPAHLQAAIAAAAIAVFGNHARVRSARRVPSSDVVSPWTQQGRMIVQASHNLRTTGR
jgi:hypothetical protein